MKHSGKIAAGIAVSVGLGLAVAVAHAHLGSMGDGMGSGLMGGMAPGGGMQRGMMGGMGPGAMRPGMMRGMNHGVAADTRGQMRGPMGAGMQNDDASSADMSLVHDLLLGHDRIKRTVSNLPDGIRTVTESDDPKVAQAIKAHVASMATRLNDGREFNIFSQTIPILFENKDRINTKVEMTKGGAIVTQTSEDSKVVAALQAHAGEVSELARDGMAAMMRSAQANMGMLRRGPRANSAPGAGPAAESHTH